MKGDTAGMAMHKGSVIVVLKEVLLSWRKRYRASKSIAFPAISTGAFGYPVEDAAQLAFGTLMEVIPELKFVKRLRFVLHSGRDLEIYERVLERCSR